MWPVLVKQFNFDFLINDPGRRVQLITPFLHFLWANLTRSNFGLGAVIYSFLMHPRAVNIAHWKQINQHINWTSPSASKLISPLELHY